DGGLGGAGNIARINATGGGTVTASATTGGDGGAGITGGFGGRGGQSVFTANAGGTITTSTGTGGAGGSGTGLGNTGGDGGAADLTVPPPALVTGAVVIGAPGANVP
ncbi:hypothetical protein B1T50_11515, partial [Mycobacterium kansasii]